MRAEGSAHGTSAAKLTVIFPTYHAADAVEGLVRGLASQRPPVWVDAERWLEAIFIDNASADDTVERLEAALAAARLDFPVRIMRNEQNLGLSRSFNRALEAVTTEFVLTCHADCRFGSEHYLAEMLTLLQSNPDIGVVSGQPIADVHAKLSRVEKVYLAANLMDIFPTGDHDLEPVGFAEGRCDGFRMEALRAAGFYDTSFRRAGEDQVLSARLRSLGYRVVRSPRLRYYLSVSSDQDSLLKLVKHAHLFGRVAPQIILANQGTLPFIAGENAGRNRTIRTTLRLLQLSGAASVGLLAVSIGTRRSTLLATGAIVATTAPKLGLFRRYVQHLDFNAGDVVALTALQPALDVAYSIGFAEGLWRVVKSRVTGKLFTPEFKS